MIVGECIMFGVGLTVLAYQLAVGEVLSPKERIKRSEYPDIYWFLMGMEMLGLLLGGTAIVLHARGIL